jgi:hypothetical protein
VQITAAAGCTAAAVCVAIAISRLRNPPRILGWIFVLMVFLGLASCLMGCTTSFVDAPPPQYRGPGFYAVRTVPTAQIASACAGASSAGERHGSVVACTKGFVVTLPNPCEWSDPFAAVMCHEQGHAVGHWGNDHPR